MAKSKEELMLEELKTMMEELKQTKAETGATLAAERKRWLPAFKLKKRFIMITAIILILLTIIFATFLSIRLIFAKEGTVVNTVSSFAEQIQELSQLATSKAYMKAVVEQEDNELFGQKIDVNIPGTKRTTLVIVPGEVVAGVDLSKVNEADIKVNEQEKLIELTLPNAAIIQEPSLFFDEVQVYSSEGLFRGTADIDEGYEIAELAQKQIFDEAVEQGILTQAEQQATAMIEKFMDQLGYEVLIEFDQE